MIFYGLLRNLVTRWCGDPEGTLQNDLIGGEGGIVSAEPAVRMQRLARLAGGHGELIAAADVAARSTRSRPRWPATGNSSSSTTGTSRSSAIGPSTS